MMKKSLFILLCFTAIHTVHASDAVSRTWQRGACMGLLVSSMGSMLYAVYKSKAPVKDKVLFVGTATGTLMGTALAMVAPILFNNGEYDDPSTPALATLAGIAGGLGGVTFGQMLSNNDEQHTA